MYVVLHCIRFGGLEGSAASPDRRVVDFYFRRLSMLFALSKRTLNSSNSFADSFTSRSTAQVRNSTEPLFDLAPKDLQLAIWIPFLISGRLPRGRECRLESAPFSPFIPFYPISSAVQPG
jgi:hypothetical protein